MEKILITVEGYQARKDELKKLLKFDRPKIIEDIDEARSHGDLKENAEYHAAKERQGFIEGRIQRLNYIIANGQPIDVATIKDDVIRFGATVSYEDAATEEETTWKIVGEDETDIKASKISVLSPIAKALIGKEEGDEVTIHIPKGKIEVEITSVSYK